MGLKEVIKAITELINAKYPDIKIGNAESKSVSRPDFYLHVVSQKIERLSPFLISQNIGFDLIYFAESSDKGYLDLLNKQYELMVLFSQILKVENFYVEIKDLNFNLDKSDYKLHTEFNISIPALSEVKDVGDVNPDNIENLELNTQLN